MRSATRPGPISASHADIKTVVLALCLGAPCYAGCTHSGASQSGGQSGAGGHGGSSGTTTASSSSGSTSTTSTTSASGSGGSAATSTASSSSGSVISGPAYYVSPSGSDANDGLSHSTPFKTLEKVQAAMRASATIKTTYLMGGDVRAHDGAHPGRQRLR